MTHQLMVCEHKCLPGRDCSISCCAIPHEYNGACRTGCCGGHCIPLEPAFTDGCTLDGMPNYILYEPAKPISLKKHLTIGGFHSICCKGSILSPIGREIYICTLCRKYCQIELAYPKKVPGTPIEIAYSTKSISGHAWETLNTHFVNPWIIRYHVEQEVPCTCPEISTIHVNPATIQEVAE